MPVIRNIFVPLHANSMVYGKNSDKKEYASKRIVLLDVNHSSSDRINNFVQKQLSRNPLYVMEMRENEERLNLSVQNKFRCPYCGKMHAIKNSIIVQERPDSLKNTLRGMLTTQRLALPHYVKFTVYQKVFYVRKCKECDEFKFKVTLLSFLIWAIFIIISVLIILFLFHWSPVLFFIPFFLSFLVFPIVHFLAGERVRFDENRAYRFNALTTETQFKGQ